MPSNGGKQSIVLPGGATLEANIPAGVRDGQKLRLNGKAVWRPAKVYPTMPSPRSGCCRIPTSPAKTTTSISIYQSRARKRSMPPRSASPRRAGRLGRPCRNGRIS
jgi:hypothetical protein